MAVTKQEMTAATLRRAAANRRANAARDQPAPPGPRPPLPLADDHLPLIALPVRLLPLGVGEIRVPAYQRPVQHTLVRRIVGGYQPRLMQPLVINLRATHHSLSELRGAAEPFVIDGQQRLTALKQLGWQHRRIQCLVYEGLTEQEEAFIYTESQKVGNRRNMQPIDHLRGAAAYGDETARAFIQTVEGHGITLDEHQPTHGKNLRAVAAGLRVARFGQDHLDRTLRLLGACFPILPGESPTRHRNRNRYGNPLLSGLSYLLRRFPELDERRLVDKLAELDAEMVLAKTADYQRIVLSGRMEVATARALAYYYNERLTARRLQFDGPDE